MKNQANLPFSPQLRQTYAAYPVWTNSRRADLDLGLPKKHSLIESQKIRKLLTKNYRKARRWKRRNPQIMSNATLRVFESLSFDFPQQYTGELYPSKKTIGKAAGVHIDTVEEALKRLRELGLLTWQRRCAQVATQTGGFILKQISNLYTLLNPANWRGFEEVAPPPEPSTWGAVPPLPSQIDEASAAAKRGAAINELAALLEMDEQDELAQQLASFGRRL